ncbi:hypothetical protein DXT99_13265 [Pontibacter diazotrophicus]|uniref:DUF3352 domain-containing protein n=1 Tax=Pontibacter diazotrophicus TaxID=1400979 RepID=A0A3D8LBG1_9BACT|nr:hypothetical protein [Pontibacter diazotrophicus]RDV14634.1 hypothetical protein DXT99_13265 [Pontibacter diazotrophicus]
MSKYIVFFFVGFVILASLLYYGFNRWTESREKVDLWTLVPESAALVIETNNHEALVEHLRETELWENFSVLPFAQRFEENFASIDSVSPGSERLSRFLNEKNILTSIHVVEQAEVGFVYYVPVTSVGEHRFLRTLTENITKSELFEESTRDYGGMLLTDVTNTRLGSGFTFFTYRNNIVLSPSPVLVEEIVRRINRTQSASIIENYRNTNYLNQPEVYANVFVNYRVMPEFLGLFLDDEVMPEVRYLSSLCENAMLQLKLERDKVFLNGFSVPETLKGSLHQVMQPQKPQPFGVKAYLPGRTAMLLHFGLEEVERMRLPQQQNGAAYAATVDSLAGSFSLEAAMAYLETNSINAEPEKVAFVHLADPDVTESLLTNLSRQVTAATKQKASTEQYGNYIIRLLPVPELPARVLGRAFEGFEQSYVVLVDDYLVFSESVATLRALLDDISEENVWSKSAVQKTFLEETLQEANFSLYLNTVNAWYILNRYAEDEERDNLLQNAALIRRFSQVSLQFSKVEEGQYYTSLVIRRPDRSNSSAGQDVFAAEQVLEFDTRLASRPYPIQNPVDRSREVAVQDSANVLINITADGRRGWADSLGTSIRGGIQQITYGQENKLRHLFATANRIHAIDNQGQELENFPFNLGDTLNIQHLAVFDYENDKNYRLLVDDDMGNLYMYDMRGAPLPGWQPRRMDYRLAAEPQHLRVGGRDVILVVLENGYIYALNRQGDTYPGFPINLNAPVTAGAVANIGADLRRTEIKAVTRYGSVVTFNLQGRVLQREQLPRPSKRALFSLVQESNSGKSFVIARQEQGQVTVFDQDLNELFAKRYVTSASKIVQYFHFGGDNSIFAVTESGPQKTYLYDSRGSLVGNRTFESTQPVTIYFNEASNNYTLYKVFRRELKQVDFSLPD